jgi:transcriptional regulator GlxA family with amidase domain
VHRVVVVAVPEVVAFDLSIPAQIFGRSEARHLYEFTVCAERPGPVDSTTGFAIEAAAGLDALRHADTVVVPGFMPTDDPGPAVDEALRDAAGRGARIASVCVGAFALAAAGLLDGRRATTHWQHADELAARFPAVRVDPDVLYVDEGQVLTSAGVAAGIDLCLHMVDADHGSAVAGDVARRMVAAMHRTGGQAQFIRRELPAGGSSLTATCDWAIAELGRPITIAEMAEHAHFSPRTLARRFVEETGLTPIRWLTEQRLLEARRLLEATDLPVEDVALRCGLGTAANLRLHLGRETGTTPTAYRRAFRGGAPGGPSRRRAALSAR